MIMKLVPYKKPIAEFTPLEAWSGFMDLTSFDGVGLDDATEEELIF